MNFIKGKAAQDGTDDHANSGQLVLGLYDRVFLTAGTGIDTQAFTVFIEAIDH